MNPYRRIVLPLALLGAVHLAPAAAASEPEALYGYADLCYLETQRAAQGTPPERLSVAACNRALHFQRLTREGRSIAFHNRGVIELAKGDADSARASFERAVQLTRKVDLRHLALALLAHRQGDHPIAVHQYDALIEVAHEHPAIARRIDILKRHRDRALRARRAEPLSEGLLGLTEH